MKSAGLEMQGVRLQICSEYEDRVDYVRLHLPEHAGSGEPHIQVNVAWHEGPGLDAAARLAFPGQEELDRVALTGTAGLAGGVTVGYEFEVTNADGIVVDGLGFWDDQADGFYLDQTFSVGLWEANTGALLRSTVITST